MMLDRALLRRPGGDDREKFAGRIGGNRLLDQRSQGRPQLVKTPLQGLSQGFTREGLASDVGAEKVPRLKHDGPLLRRQALHSVLDERKVSACTKPVAEQPAGLRHLIGIASLECEEHEASGKPPPHFGQQKPLSGRRSFRQQIAQLSMDGHMRRRHPYAAGHQQDPEQRDRRISGHRPAFCRRVITDRSPSGERIAIVATRPSEPVRRM
jgi:hypothetical protein